jgi:4-amino-4-deoxy-L-arabinose transferase-like glycosyltransferase
MKNVKIFVSDLNQFLRRELKELRFDRYVYWLCIIFTAVFLNTIFIMNDLNSSVLGSISADHASMFESMKMILSTSGLYNMHEGYHSSFYGWTYFFFSFWLLLPVKILFSLWEADTAIPIFIGLKTLHFFYGLLAAISFYYLARRFFNKIVSFGAAFILTFATSLTEYNYLFHPETIGVFFLNLACIYLIDFARGKNKESDREIYYWAILLFLVLCTLAKPTFFLITAPLYICLFTLTLKQKNIILNSTIAFKNSLKILRKTILFSLSVFFIIHPFFFVLINK